MINNPYYQNHPSFKLNENTTGTTTIESFLIASRSKKSPDPIQPEIIHTPKLKHSGYPGSKQYGSRKTK